MNDIKLTRRQFTAFVSGLVFAGVFPKVAFANIGTKSTYSVSILGDMHYDSVPPERFHANAIPVYESNPKRKTRLRDFKRNATMWQGISQSVLASAHKVLRKDTAFALQLGDLVQGDCMDSRIHTKMLSEATEILEETFPDIPVISVCGNHDIRDGQKDQGEAKTYADFFIPWESRQLKKNNFFPRGVANTTFGFRTGDDLWIVIDFNYGKRDFKLVKELLEQNRDVRYTFVATHGPVLPMDLWHCRWFYLGVPALDDLRREMRALLAKRHAIVLSGHIHSVELRDWFGEGGRITEFVFNTVAIGRLPDKKWGFFPAAPWVVTDNPSDFGQWIRDGKKPPYNSSNLNSKACTVGMKELYDEYLPGLKTYMASRAFGHYMLRVSDFGVKVEYYGHDATKPTKVYTLR